MPLTVAGFQQAVVRDVKQNREAIKGAIRRAAEAGADILLTPEGSVSGFRLGPKGPDVPAVRQAIDHITALARELEVGLALGTVFEEEDGKRYNQLRFYEKDGRPLGFHSKILLTGPLDGSPGGERSHCASTPLRTFEFQGITIGGLLCNDLWASPTGTPDPDPHLSQQLSARGARIIFHGVNGFRAEPDRAQLSWNYAEANLRLRALAGKIWVVTVDNCDPVDRPCSAPSGVIDPAGNWRCQTKDRGEDFFVVRIELDQEERQ